MARQGYVSPQSRNDRYYKAYKSDRFGYCQKCSKQMYVKDFKTIPGPKRIIRELKVCEQCEKEWKEAKAKND